MVKSSIQGHRASQAEESEFEPRPSSPKIHVLNHQIKLTREMLINGDGGIGETL